MKFVLGFIAYLENRGFGHKEERGPFSLVLQHLFGLKSNKQSQSVSISLSRQSLYFPLKKLQLSDQAQLAEKDGMQEPSASSQFTTSRKKETLEDNNIAPILLSSWSMCRPFEHLV